jgi:tripartite-type tricarboxylate transporter receptor subunit TctC
MAGIKLLHVPYKGSDPAATAALGGEVHFVITGIGTLVSHWKAGKLKVLAFGADKRHPKIATALASADLKDRLTANGFDVFTSTPDEFARFIRNDVARTAKVI